MKPRTATGLAFLIGALPCFGAGLYLMQIASDQEARAARQANVTERQCKERLETIGNVRDAGNGAFEVTVRRVTDARKALAELTVAQSVCPQKSIASACLGEACGPAAAGVTLKFRLDGAKR